MAPSVCLPRVAGCRDLMTPRPMTITSYGTRCDQVGILREGVYPGLSWRALNAVGDVLRRETEGALRQKRRRALDQEAGEMRPQAKENLEPPNAGRDEGSVLEPSK